MHRKQTSFVLVLLLGAMYANSAWGVEKRRIGEAGAWSNGQQWEPAGSPEAADNCFQEDEATGVMVFDTGTYPAANSLTVKAGGSPPRGLTVAGPDEFRTPNFVKTGAGAYTVTVLDNQTFRTTPGAGGITGGNWLLGADALVQNRGTSGINVQDGTWTLGPRALLWNFPFFTSITGDTSTSRIALLGAGS